MDKVNDSTLISVKSAAQLKHLSDMKNFDHKQSKEVAPDNKKSATETAAKSSHQTLATDKVEISAEGKTISSREINEKSVNPETVSDEKVAEEESTSNEEKQVEENNAKETDNEETQSDVEALDQQIRELEQKIVDLSTQIALLEAQQELQLRADDGSNRDSETDKEIRSLKVDLAITEGMLKIAIERRLEASKVESVE